MKKAFETLKKISNDYCTAVDSLSEMYERSGAEDYLYSEAVKAQRIQDRNADFNGRISRAAEKAQQEASMEIAKLREAVQRYITTSTDLATVQTLQALITSGVELTSAEIAAFAEKGGFGVLRILEKPSKGHVKAPSLESFELDLRDLESHFRDIVAYRGGLAAIGPGGRWGQSSTVGSTIMRGQLDQFSEKLDEMAERWSCVIEAVACE